MNSFTFLENDFNKNLEVYLLVFNIGTLFTLCFHACRRSMLCKHLWIDVGVRALSGISAHCDVGY